eukprot:UN26250
MCYDGLDSGVCNDIEHLLPRLGQYMVSFEAYGCEPNNPIIMVFFYLCYVEVKIMTYCSGTMLSTIIDENCVQHCYSDPITTICDDTFMKDELNFKQESCTEKGYPYFTTGF